MYKFVTIIIYDVNNQGVGSGEYKINMKIIQIENKDSGRGSHNGYIQMHLDEDGEESIKPKKHHIFYVMH